MTDEEWARMAEAERCRIARYLAARAEYEAFETWLTTGGLWRDLWRWLTRSP